LLLSIFSFPLIIENTFVLNLWLKNVPEYASVFCQIVLLQSLLSAMITPIAFCVHATGKIKLMNLINGILYSTILPVSYLFFRLGFSPVYGFLTNLMLSVIGFFVWLLILKKYIDYSIRKFFKQVVSICLFITSISLLFPIIIHFKLDYGWLRFILVLFSTISSFFAFSYLFAIDKKMRKRIHFVIREKLALITLKNHD
jgi:hypothetical protein